MSQNQCLVHSTGIIVSPKETGMNNKDREKLSEAYDLLAVWIGCPDLRTENDLMKAAQILSDLLES